MFGTRTSPRAAARRPSRGERSRSNRDQLVQQNLPLIYEAAWQVKRRVGDHVTLEELVSAGTLGLLEALERFDPGRGLKLSTYVLPRIRGAILDDLRRRDWMPRRVRSQSRHLTEAERRLEQQHNRSVRHEEVAAQLEVDLTRYWRMRDDAAVALMPLEHRTGTRSADPDNPAQEGVGTGPDSQMLEGERIGQIKAALATLAPRECTVLSLTYFEELPGNEIARVLGVSESRVSQIKQRALTRLRQSGCLQELMA